MRSVGWFVLVGAALINACAFEWDGYDPRLAPEGPETPGPPCEDGATEPCYGGPDGTEGVGVCAAGIRTCTEGAFGACVGEFTPSTELCATPEDDDCDGEAVEADCYCESGETFSCYEGAPETLDVGACHAGVQTCGADSTPSGACLAQTLPRLEECATPADDDCDGTANDWCGSWIQRWGNSADQRPLSGTLRDDVYAIVGELNGTIDFGGATLTSAGLGDWMIASLDAADGSHRWSLSLGGPNEDMAWDVAIDAAGDHYVIGDFDGTVTIDGQMFTSVARDVLVLKLAAADGSLVWAYHLSGAGVIEADGIAVDDSGNVAVVGASTGDFEPIAAMPIATQGKDGFIVMLDSLGAVKWATDIGESSTDVAEAVAFDANGNVVIVGSFDTAIDIDTRIDAVGADDAFVLKLDGDGNEVFAARLGESNATAAYELAIDAADNIIVVGAFDGSIDFGAGAVASEGGLDAFVAKLSPAGVVQWGKLLSGPSEQLANGVSVTSTGDLLIATEVQGRASIDDAVIAPAGDDDMLLLWLDGEGNLQRARRFGDHGDQEMRRAFEHGGGVLFHGDCAETLIVAEGISESADDDDDVCLVRLQP